MISPISPDISYPSEMPNPNRTALLIRCSVEQAEQIREAARREHRTVSGFVLNCLEYKLRIQAAVHEKMKAAMPHK